MGRQRRHRHHRREERDFLYSADTQINAPIDIELDFFTNPGHVFLGWARLDEEGHVLGRDANGNPNQFKDESGLDRDDLWLEFYPAGTDPVNGNTYDTGYFKVKNDDVAAVNGKVVSQIAADENEPYHIMYAVWSQSTYYYVFHSSDGELEAREIRDSRSVDPIDLTQLVKPGYLYGGYYSDYGGFSDENLLQAEYNAPYKDGKFNVPDVVTYDATALKATVTEHGQTVNQRFWTKTDAGTTPGNAIVPHTGDVFCLKEVPETYLTTKYLYTYDLNNGNQIQNFFMLTVMDDAFYKEIGFRTVKDAVNVQQAAKAGITPRTAIAGKFEVIQRGNGIAGHPRCDDTVVTVDPSNFGLTRGFIAVTKADDLIEAGKSFTVMPAWKTLDGVEVNSHGTLKLSVSSDKKTIGYDLLGDVATPTTLFIDTDPSHLVLNQDDGTVWETNDALTRVYISNGSKDMWLDATKLRNNYYSVSIPTGEWTLNVVRCDPDPTKTGWAAAWTQTVDIPLESSKDLLILNSGFNDGKLNKYTYTVVNN